MPWRGSESPRPAGRSAASAYVPPVFAELPSGVWMLRCVEGKRLCRNSSLCPSPVISDPVSFIFPSLQAADSTHFKPHFASKQRGFLDRQRCALIHAVQLSGPDLRCLFSRSSPRDGAGPPKVPSHDPSRPVAAGACCAIARLAENPANCHCREHTSTGAS